MTTKKKSLNQKKENNPFDNILTKGFKLDTPFIDYRDTVVMTIGKYMNKYFEICSDNTLWNYEDYDKRISENDKLKTIRKSVRILLKSLIPEKALSNKHNNPLIRVFKDHPDILVDLVKNYLELIDKHITRPRISRDSLESEIVRVAREIFKVDADKLIVDFYIVHNFDSRTNRNIAISILALQLGVKIDYLHTKYYEAKKKINTNS